MVTCSWFVIVGAMPPDICVDFRHPSEMVAARIARSTGMRVFIQQ
jgi:hypothetical protein